MSREKIAVVDPKKQAQQKLVLSILIFGAIIYGLYALLFEPKLEVIGKLDASLQQSMQEESKLKQILSKREKITELFEQNTLILLCMEKELFPPQMNAVVWISKFAHDVFAKNNIKASDRSYRAGGVKNLLSKSDNPKDAKNRFYLEDFQLDITASGNYSVLGGLLGDFEQKIPYATLSGFTINHGNSEQLSLNINLLVPRFNAAGREEFGKVKNFYKKLEVKR